MLLDRAVTRNEAEAPLDEIIPWSEVTPNDVLGGRGAFSNNHPGNRFFRERCAFYWADYVGAATRHDRVAIERMIVNDVLSTGGRFLTPSSFDGNIWTNVSGDGRQLHYMVRRRMRHERDGLRRGGIVNRDRNLLRDDFEFNLNAFIVYANVTGWSPTISRSFRFRSHF